MKIVFLNGGLANQAFQYIFYRIGQILNPAEEWLMDDSFFFTNDVHNGYEIDRVFDVRPNLLSEYFESDVWDYMIELKRSGKSIPEILLESGEDISKVLEANYASNWNPFSGKKLVIDEIDRLNPNITTLPGNIYYHGYWIHKKWFRLFEAHGEKLTFPEITDDLNQEILKNIRENMSTSIHLRRGDYIDLGLTPDSSQIKTMIENMLAKIPDSHLFVFSDDVDWCKKNESNLGFDKCREVYYVSNNHGKDAFRDMQLMSNCKNMILSNSAFCYLAALLNKNIGFCINPNKNRPL